MKKLFFQALLLISCLTASAQSNVGKVNVLYLDGTSHEVKMSEVARMEVADGNMKLIGKDAANTKTHKISDIKRIELTGSVTAIASLRQDNAITIRSNGYKITAEGIADGTTLEVYSQNGQLMGKAKAYDGHATYDATSLPLGIYVVKAGTGSLKMVKK